MCRDLSGREEWQALSQTLEPVARQAERLKLPWILIGAVGRDLILACAGLKQASRATLDVDIAVLVTNWEEFARLKNALIKHEGAIPDPDAKQRVSLGDSAPLDIVPFGGVESGGKIEWPPESAPILDVRGLIEAEKHSICVRLPGNVEVRVPIPEVFICLKLFAWKDRHYDKPRHDSADLADLFRNAEDLVGTMEAMSDEHEKVQERNEWDLELVGIHLDVANFHELIGE